MSRDRTKKYSKRELDLIASGNRSVYLHLERRLLCYPDCKVYIELLNIPGIGEFMETQPLERVAGGETER